jgi:MazG family protein
MRTMTGAKFEKLVEIMATLRGPNGCPWDKEQTYSTLKPMMVEEIYEVLEAIDNQDFDHLSEELGDVLLHIVFQAQMGKEESRFNIDTVIDGICAKLIRRHPHVFAGEAGGSADDVLRNWQVIKAAEAAEKEAKSSTGSHKIPSRKSLLDGIPGKLPALHEAHQISSRVARVGFDWPNIDGIFEKLEEEVHELREAIAEKQQADIEDEVGDLFFVLVNIARVLKVDSESALKRANRKFKTRFQHMESELAQIGKTLDETSFDQMESLWKLAKKETDSQ